MKTGRERTPCPCDVRVRFVLLRAQMHQCFLGMLGAAGRIALLAGVHGALPMRDGFREMGTGFFLLGRFGMFQGRFGVLHENIRMSGLPVLDRFLRVLDSFLLMRLGRPGDAADHKCESAEKQRHSRQFLQHTAYLLLCTLTTSDLRDSRARTIFYVPVRHRNTRFFMVSMRSGIAHALIYAGGCSPDSF